MTLLWNYPFFSKSLLCPLLSSLYEKKRLCMLKILSDRHNQDLTFVKFEEV